MKTFPFLPQPKQPLFFSPKIISLKVNVTFCTYPMKKQHLSGCVKKLLTAPTVSCTDRQVDILQGMYVAWESRVQLTHLTTCKRHCQNQDFPMEAMPCGIPGSSVSEAGSEAAVRLQLQCLSSHFSC